MSEPMLNYSQLIKFDSGGIKIATYAEIKNWFSSQWKLIYGNDIDLTPMSADGILLENLTLMISNILQVIQSMYSNLDVNTAQGVYLDRLMGFNNIFRYSPTASYAFVNIVGLAPNTEYEDLVLLDVSGNTWTCIPFTSSSTGTIDSVRCNSDIKGAVFARSGSINKTVELMGGVVVTQPNDAIIGRDSETDIQFRSRRGTFLSRYTSTLSESLKANLSDLPGVTKVFIFNNDTGGQITIADQFNTIVDNHDIYIKLQLSPGVVIDSKTIGQIIYDYKTPGIRTTDFSEAEGDSRLFVFEVVNNELGISNKVYWMVCDDSQTPTITCSVIPYPQDGFALDWSKTVLTNILDDMKNYASNRDIDEVLNEYEIGSIMRDADPLINNKPTYTVTGVSISATGSSKYNGFRYNKIVGVTQSNKSIQVTLSFDSSSESDIIEVS